MECESAKAVTLAGIAHAWHLMRTKPDTDPNDVMSCPDYAGAISNEFFLFHS